jgi:hypothetical protein
MGKVMGPVSAVSGFHGAGPVRRACGMCFVTTVRASASSGQAFAVANRDAIVAPVSRRQVGGRILIFRLTGRGTASRLYGCD